MRKIKANAKLAMLFFGMTATGKSYVAQAWAKKWGFPYFNSDIVRKGLAGRDLQGRQEDGIDEGIYTPEFTRQTYDVLLKRAEQTLGTEKGDCVVIDASYGSRSERDRVRDCLEGKCRLFFVHCTCPEEVVRERLAVRAKDQCAVSDGRWDIYLKQKRDFDQPEELEAGQLMPLETNRPLSELLQILERELRSRGEERCLQR